MTGAARTRPRRARTNGSAVPKASRESATYVYCVARAPSFRLPPRAPRLPGASKPRAIELGADLWLVVSDVPLRSYGQKSLERGLRDLDWVSRCAFAHQAAVAQLAKVATVAPMKLFTIFASDQRATSHLRRIRARIVRLLDRVTGHQEWGVRLRFDAKRAKAGLSARRPSRRPQTGRGFLMLKHDQKRAVQQLSSEAHARGERLFAELGRGVAGALRRTLANQETSGGVLLDAAFLVADSGARDFKRKVLAAAEQLRDHGIALALTGPWPAYSFLAEPVRGR